MSQWYQHNHRLFREERESLAAACPLMMLSVVGSGFPINAVVKTPSEYAIAHGTYILDSPDIQGSVEYGIALWLPEKYPISPPIMFCNDPKLPINVLDRHILSDGQACLEVRPEIRRRWPWGSNLANFLVNLVEPFLAWQTYYLAFGKPPEWGDRPHGISGLIDYYSEFLGIEHKDNLLGYLNLIARKNKPKGHEPCPCNSGLKIRNCHKDFIYKAREELCQEDVAHDLKTIKENAKFLSKEQKQETDVN